MKSSSFSAVQEIPRVLGDSKLCYRFQKKPQVNKIILNDLIQLQIRF